MELTTHQLKLVQPHYDAVASGAKTFENRKDDRGYQVGDVLVLREYDAETDTFSGKELRRSVTHILRGEEWGVMDGYVVLLLMPVTATESNSICKIRIVNGFGWYKKKVGEEFDVIRMDGFDYVVWESEEAPSSDYDIVREEDAEVIGS